MPTKKGRYLQKELLVNKIKKKLWLLYSCCLVCSSHCHWLRTRMVYGLNAALARLVQTCCNETYLSAKFKVNNSTSRAGFEVEAIDQKS